MSISLGDTITGSIENISDEDWFSIALEAGKTYLFETLSDSLSEVTPRLAVYNPEERFEDGTASKMSFQPETSGVYFLKLHDLGDLDTGSYSFTTSLVETVDNVNVVTTITNRSGAALTEVIVALDDGSALLTDKTETGLSEFAITRGSNISLTGSLDYNRSSKSITSQDALDALRLAVGMETQNGSKSAFDFIAADFNKDGKVSSQDALAILKYAVGLSTTEQVGWVFVYSDGEYTGISRTNTNYDEGVTITDLTSATELSLTGILIGDVNDSYGGLVA